MASEDLEGRQAVALERIRLYLEALEKINKSAEAVCANPKNGGDESEKDNLYAELGEVIERIDVVQNERHLVALRRAEVLNCQIEVEHRINALHADNFLINEEVNSCRTRSSTAESRLILLCNTHVANDAFHIWYTGALVTINNFRVGRLPAVQVGWPEINAGLGQAAIALNIVRSAMNLPSSRYAVVPLGSTSKVIQVDDGKTAYNLFSDERFMLFPKRNFNMALKIFLSCIFEAGIHASKSDPTLQLPYKIDENDATVGGIPVSMGNNLEAWTRAMKYMLTNLKWLLAWVAKYEVGIDARDTNSA